jgi:hypothetical protein
MAAWASAWRSSGGSSSTPAGPSSARTGRVEGRASKCACQPLPDHSLTLSCAFV